MTYENTCFERWLPNKSSWSIDSEGKTTRMCQRQNWTRFEMGSARVNYNYIWLSPFILSITAFPGHVRQTPRPPTPLILSLLFPASCIDWSAAGFIAVDVLHAVSYFAHTISHVLHTNTNTLSLSLSLSLYMGSPMKNNAYRPGGAIEASCGWTAVIQQDDELPCRVSRISLLLRTFYSEQLHITKLALA
jgi:hypothetical protein